MTDKSGRVYAPDNIHIQWARWVQSDIASVRARVTAHRVLLLLLCHLMNDGRVNDINARRLAPGNIGTIVKYMSVTARVLFALCSSRARARAHSDRLARFNLPSASHLTKHIGQPQSCIRISLRVGRRESHVMCTIAGKENYTR